MDDTCGTCGQKTSEDPADVFPTPRGVFCSAECARQDVEAHLAATPDETAPDSEDVAGSE